MLNNKNHNGPDFRVEEAIWGHRLHDEQSGSMVAMEFLNVLNFLPFAEFDKELKNAQVQKPSKPRELEYESYRRMSLRTLLFNNPFIEHINENMINPWKTWSNLFAPTSSDENDIEDKGRAKSNRDLLEDWRIKPTTWNSTYLRRAFGGGHDDDKWESFHNFADVLKLIRACSFNVNSNKRWTSLFVFPWGKDCLYAETDEKGSPDKRFFGRSGELLYILLSYADHRHELEKLIRTLYFDTQNPLNTICRVLQGEPVPSNKPDENNPSINVSVVEPNEIRLKNSGATGPVTETQQLYIRANLLCNDLISILQSRLPAEELFAHFSRIIGLHLMCYFLERGIEASDARFYRGEEIPPEEIQKSFNFFCEILAPRMTSIRHTSQGIYANNKALSKTAIKTYIDTLYEKALDESKHPRTEDLAENQFILFKKAFYKIFDISKNKQDDYEKLPNSEDIKKLFVEKVQHRHAAHWGNVIHEYGKAIGLSSRSGTNRYRYCPDDELIVTLMLANVESERILLDDFLEKIFRKYHIVIGFQGLSCLLPKRLNESDVNANLERFKSRLKSLGLLDTLSDGYDFIQNTFYVRAENKED